MSNPAALPSSANRGPRVILATTHGVCSEVFGQLCHSFAQWADVKAITTTESLQFIDRASLTKGVPLYTESDVTAHWTKFGDPILHFGLLRWADVLIIAPLSASIMGEIANGLSNSMLTSLVRAWDYEKPMFIAPAMRSLVWRNQFTERHLHMLDNLGATLIRPVTRRLADGDVAEGAMAEPELINDTVRLFWERNNNDCQKN